jgi:hypothetical protein
MRVKPKRDYSLLGTSIVLDSTKVYDASHATNLPDWEERGLIFVHARDEDPVGVLLEAGEYEIVG